MKVKSDKYVSLVCFLTAGLAVPLVCSLLVGIIIRRMEVSTAMLQIRSLVIWVGGIYFGLMIFRNYIAPRYKSYNKDKVIRYATFYHVIFPLFTVLIAGLFSTHADYSVNPAGIAVSLTASAISAYIFYKLSHRLIREKTASQA